MEKSPELKSGIVCVLDALGTKGIWTREEPSKVLKKWEKLIASFKNLSNVPSEKNLFSSPPNVKAFSDTIIITHHGDNLETMMLRMGAHVGVPFIESLEEGIYLRGAITVGNFYESETSLIGPAIDEVVNWYEKADWFGVLLTPSASFLTDSFELFSDRKSGVLTKYDVPLKNKTTVNTWVLNWPITVSRIFNKNEKKFLSHSFANATILDDSYSKYYNTQKFYNEQINS